MSHKSEQPDPNDIASILSPLFTTFSFPQIESLLYAYVPNSLPQKYKTGIYAVDTFAVTASCTILLVVVKLVIKLLSQVMNFKKLSKKVEISEHISVVIEPTHYDDYHSTPNIYHQALSHLISDNAQDKTYGYYKLKPDMEIDHETGKPPAFNMVPEPDQVHTIEFEGNTFQVTFQTANDKTQPSKNTPKSDTSNILPGSKYSKPGIRSSTSTEPHIIVSIISSNQADITVSTISNFLETTTKDYMVYAESLKKKNRSRYDYSVSGKWVRICSLYEVQGLDTVALCPMNEALIKEDLNSFKSNKAFYKRIGFPYRRGLLFHGPPGTGKTSLVFAIASELQRDLYFMNLSYIDSDSELFQAFANVPANSIVVFEDVDTMSTSLHRRNAAAASQSPQEINNHAVGSEESANAAVTRKFNLSTFLSVLDGHTLEDGIIFIMTTNHQERLDPAIIRPGRMDIHLDLRYATYYQMRRIYKMVIDQEDDESSLDGIYPNLEKEIKEFVVPPSEIMQVMVLCRSKKNRMEIPRKIIQLNEKYNNKN